MQDLYFLEFKMDWRLLPLSFYCLLDHLDLPNADKLAVFV